MRCLDVRKDRRQSMVSQKLLSNWDIPGKCDCRAFWLVSPGWTGQTYGTTWDTLEERNLLDYRFPKGGQPTSWFPDFLPPEGVVQTQNDGELFSDMSDAVEPTEPKEATLTNFALAWITVCACSASQRCCTSCIILNMS